MTGRTMLGATLLLALATTPAQAQHWSRSWMAAPLVSKAPPEKRPDLANRTLRQVVRISSGGQRIRLRLSNEMSTQPLLLGAVHVAIAGENGETLPGTDHVVTFNQAQGATIPARAPLLSDPIAMAVKPLTRLSISIHLPQGAPDATVHSYSAATGWTAPGDQTTVISLSNSATLGPRVIISGVEVESRKPGTTIVTLGDSITDGVRATPDSNRRWPDLLAERLQKAGRTSIGVANAGISANRLLSEGDGYNALARFDSDVLAVPGVTHVVILEGVNDLGNAARSQQPMLPPEALIGAYRQMIARAHHRGVKVILATILPYKGAGYWSAEGDAARMAVNKWIRDNQEADAFVDLDKAIADPADPARMAKAYDVGDALHPNDEGFRAMAAAFDLKLFQ
ncbi:MAG TPA: esterase [Sphingobium sp.]|uniref:SGNH/GDSL hydrolase family protein n=1 Tax=unclassified Sphingobium TaxID=2611147 RepID=UPI000EDE630F|nr:MULTISPECIES: SGNH/GDSL hydrolase family protein [unclassified Sphingobium]WIW88206.1 SGNH/GDSL hydrolase family protein [Sphingobium sp. V4]HAF43199.1 esterase [Sphingobium sp.]